MHSSLFLIFLLFACSEDEFQLEFPILPEPTFVVANRGEKMPVWIHGNENSNFIILAVHGGPGSDVLDFRTFSNGEGFKKIESSHLVCYWQQRASGQSQGPNGDKYFTINQYAEDCDKVVEELLSRYPGKVIVIFGHSWGGMLSGYYLSNSQYRSKIKAWINAAGVHNGSTLLQASIDDVLMEADYRIANNENLQYWEDIKIQVQRFPERINSIAYQVIENISEVPIKVGISDFNFSDRARISNQALFPEILSTNLTSDLNDFTFPILVIWGKYDFVVSKKLRDELLMHLQSTSLTNAELSASGHYMMFHEPMEFADHVLDFMDDL